jgi:hypothetical protein
MADLKISQLPAATTPLAGTEELAVVQGSETRRVAASAVGTPITTPLTVPGTASSTGAIRLAEDTDNGTNYVAFAAPSSISADVTWTLPASDGTSGQVLSTNGSAVLSWATAASGGSKTLAVFTPLDNQPPATDFATLDTRNSVALLDFDDAAPESAVFVGVIPEGAVLTSGIIVRLSWSAAAASPSGDCRWLVDIEKTTGHDIDADGYDTAVAGTTTTSGTSGLVNTTAITITTIDSVAAGDAFRVRVRRDAANAGDTMTGDAELVAVEVRAA